MKILGVTTVWPAPGGPKPMKIPRITTMCVAPAGAPQINENPWYNHDVASITTMWLTPGPKGPQINERGRVWEMVGPRRKVCGGLTPSPLASGRPGPLQGADFRASLRRKVLNVTKF